MVEVRILWLRQKSGQEDNGGLADSFLSNVFGGESMEHPRCKKPPEQGAVSVELPSQEEAKEALGQWRDLNFLPLVQVGSHSDQSPHSAQVLAAPAEKKKKKEIDKFLPNKLLLSMSKGSPIEI